MIYCMLGLKHEQDVDLPEARWQFHVMSPEVAWGIDEQGRYQPVKIYADREDHYRLKVTWPSMADVPEEIRWKLA